MKVQTNIKAGQNVNVSVEIRQNVTVNQTANVTVSVAPTR
jgi:hypothetical protein